LLILFEIPRHNGCLGLMNKNGIAISLPMYSSISAISVDCIYAKVHMVGLFWMTKEKCVGETVKIIIAVR
jgi:hypothetical protein